MFTFFAFYVYEQEGVVYVQEFHDSLWFVSTLDLVFVEQEIRYLQKSWVHSVGDFKQGFRYGSRLIKSFKHGGRTFNLVVEHRS